MRCFIFQHEGYMLFNGLILEVSFWFFLRSPFVWLSRRPDGCCELAGSVFKSIVEVPSRWGEVALSAQSHVAWVRHGVSALYPPHRNGLTHFSNSQQGGWGLGSLRLLKIPHYRQLHCRGIPGIAVLDYHEVGLYSIGSPIANQNRKGFPWGFLAAALLTAFKCIAFCHRGALRAHVNLPIYSQVHI